MTDVAETLSSVTAADRRRIGLLQQIRDAGGAVSPVAAPQAKNGYANGLRGDDVDSDLSHLARRNYLEARFFDRVSLCPKCESHHLNVREVCPGCRRAHLTSEGLLHHFRCGFVGIPAEFTPLSDGAFRCPKCNGKLRHIGTEYDRLGKAFLCRSCGVISEYPPVEAVCLSCGARTPSENLISTTVFSYVMTSRGAAALRAGSLYDDDDEPMSVADAPVYKRPIMLEFLDNELKRMGRSESEFCVLTARYAPEGSSSDSPTSQAPWLIRLRNCLREADLLGQLGDALYAVILPNTKRREAEAILRRVAADLGTQSPLTLSLTEIKERRPLAQVLVDLGGRFKEQ